MRTFILILTFFILPKFLYFVISLNLCDISPLLYNFGGISHPWRHLAHFGALIFTPITPANAPFKLRLTTISYQISNFMDQHWQRAIQFTTSIISIIGAQISCSQFNGTEAIWCTSLISDFNFCTHFYIAIFHIIVNVENYLWCLIHRLVYK